MASKINTLLSLVTLASLLIFTGCGKKEESENSFFKKSPKQGEYILKFSHVVDPNTPKGKAADFFEKRLEELTNGQIDVQVFPSSQLYKDNTVLKAVEINSVQMAAPSFSKFNKIVPQLALFDLPFLFKDINHLHRVQDGEVGQRLKDMVTQKGFVALSYWDNHFKQLTSSKKPILLPQDAKDQKFRIMPSSVIKAQFDVIGADPQILPFSEVYFGLKRKIIDGQENTNSNIYTKRFHEVQKYLTLTNHGYLGYLVVMSEEFWNSLSPELQAKVNQAIKEATKKEREYANELNLVQLNEIRAYSKQTGNLEIFELNPSQLVKWREVVREIYPLFYDKNKIGKDLIKATLATE
jgi:C4-dicarboxylate-binding protein DctP